MRTSTDRALGLLLKAVTVLVEELTEVVRDARSTSTDVQDSADDGGLS